MQSIFSYIDYRKYLSDYYDWAKENRKYFSYRFFSQRAGINSPNFLKLVIEGKRNLTRSTIEKFIKALNIKEKEALFFKNLVMFNQARTALEKQEHYLILKAMAGQVRQQILGADCYEYFDRWYTAVVRELVCRKTFDGDLAKVAAQIIPRVKTAQVKSALDLLFRLGMLKKDDEGRFLQTDVAVATEPQVTSMAVRNHNRKMIQLAEASLDGMPVEKRYASGLTMGMARQCYDVILAEIDAFKDRIVNIVNSYDRNETVCQLNIQLYPLVKDPEEGDILE